MITITIGRAKPPVPKPARPPSAFFDAGDTPELLAYKAQVLARVEKLSFPTKPASMRVRNADGTVATMDASDGSFDSIKGAYSMRGDTIPEAQLLWYASQGFPGYQVLAIIAQHWLVNRACEMPARDAVRKGYTVTVNDGTPIDPATLDKIKKADKRFNITKQLQEFVKMGRVFGVRIAMFKVDSTDPLYYQNPFNPDGITPGSYKGISQIDPYWVAPELSMAAASDPSAPDFYEPTYWLVQGKRIHKSHLIIMRGPQVSDILKPSYQYGGLSVPQMIAGRVYAAERTADEVPQLALSKRAMVFFTDIKAALMDEESFIAKLWKWATYRDNFGVKIAGTDDKIEQHDTSLTGLDEAVMTQYQIVAAVSGVPATKLLGTTPKGFNGTGEAEEDNYHEELESIQTNDMEPFLERHHMLLIRSEIAPDAPFDTSVVWAPLDVVKEKERAEINKINAETGAVLVTSGAIDGIDERARITADENSGYTGLPEVMDADPAAVVETTALDASLWDPVAGTFAEAALITNQRHIDDAIVAAKIVDQDFEVQLSPEFITASGKRVRVIIDGHHSLQAAIRSGNEPYFVENNYAGSDYVNVVTQLSGFDHAK